MRSAGWPVSRSSLARIIEADVRAFLARQEQAWNAARLDAYFDLIRGESATHHDDAARESYMAGWVRAARDRAGDRPVVVVTGGFHRPALIRLLAGRDTASTVDNGAAGWPEVPRFPEGAVGGSYLVPYSFKRLDAFHGYQSGMPSPGYHQRLWEAVWEDSEQEVCA